MGTLSRASSTMDASFGAPLQVIPEMTLLLPRRKTSLAFPLWLKTPASVAWVAGEVRVRSLAQRSELKDPALPQLQWPQLRFSPWPRNFRMLWGVAIKKKKRKKEKGRQLYFSV